MIIFLVHQSSFWQDDLLLLLLKWRAYFITVAESPFRGGTNSQLDACRQQNVNKLRHVRRIYSTSTRLAHRLQTTPYPPPSLLSCPLLISSFHCRQGLSVLSCFWSRISRWRRHWSVFCSKLAALRKIQALKLPGSVQFEMVQSIVVTNLYSVLDVRDGATFVSLAIAVN